MKIIKNNIAILLILFFLSCSSEKFSWDNYTLEYAVIVASGSSGSDQKKPIMIDFYADW